MLRRAAAMLCLLMLLTGARAQHAYVVQAAGVAALVDADGDILVREGTYDEIFTLVEDALYAAGSAGDYALIDARGTQISDESYEMLEAVGDVLLYRQGGFYGAMDLKGNALIAPVWSQLTYAGSRRFIALKGDLYDDQPDELLSISANGEKQSTGSYTADGLHDFSDGRMAFTLSDGTGGYVDALGRQVIPPEWLYAGDFADGAAIVSGEAGMGLIDVEGKVAVAAGYVWMRRGDGIIAALTADSRLDVYTADGREKRFALESIEEAEICGRCVVARDAGAARLYDPNGRCICEAARGALFYPGLDGQVIMADGAWGESCQRLLNLDGSDASRYHQYLLPLCGGRYASLTFDPVQSDADGSVAWDYDGARCALMDAGGHMLTGAEYLEILPAGDDRLVLVTEGEVRFTDLDGRALREWPVIETAASSSEAGA